MKNMQYLEDSTSELFLKTKNIIGRKKHVQEKPTQCEKKHGGKCQQICRNNATTIQKYATI